MILRTVKRLFNWLGQTDEKDFSHFHFKKHRHPQLEFHVTHQCDLHCPGCAHYCDIGYDHPIVAEVVLDWLKLWSQRLDPAVVRLVGGEPLLSDDLPLFIGGAAESFPKAHREVVSNGLHLHRWDDSLPIVMSRTHTALTISEHQLPERRQSAFIRNLEQARQWAKDYGLNLRIGASPTHWFQLHRGRGADIIPGPVHMGEESWLTCPFKTSVNLHQGKLWPCPVLAYMPLVAEKFTNLDLWLPYMYYKPLDFSASDFELEAFLNGRHRREFCGICAERKALPRLNLRNC